MAQRRAAQLGGLIRSGQSATAIGLAFNGLAAYVFLAAAGRSLGPAEFAPLSVLWTMLFLVATGLFQPFEQELARAVSANRSLGLGYSEVVRRNAVVAAALVACVILIGAIAAGPIAEGFFRGERSFVIALVVGIAGIGFMFFVRGLLAGSGRFYGFAVLFVADGLTKSLPAVIFWLAGGRNPSVFVAVLVAGGFVGGAAPLTRGGVRATDPGPIPQWGAVIRAIGLLLITATLSQTLLNMGTLAVEVLSSSQESTSAGVFLSGLSISRVPLFLSQAIQAVLLPRLSRLATNRDEVEFRRTTSWLLGAVFAATVVATIVSAALGPLAVRLLFGPDFAVLGARDMGLLTFASLTMMCVLTINQIQIAVHDHHHAGWPWGVGVVAFVLVAAFASDDLFLRVELAMVAGAVCTVAIAIALLNRAVTTTFAAPSAPPAPPD